MASRKLLAALVIISASMAGIAHSPVQAETIRVYYRMDRQCQQGPFSFKNQAQTAMNRWYEQKYTELRIIHEPLMDTSGKLTGFQYFVRGVAKGKVETRDFTNRAEATRFYQYKRQTGFKVAHKIRK